MFSTRSDNCIPICPIFDIISLFATDLEEPKTGISGKGLKTVFTGVKKNLLNYQIKRFISMNKYFNIT